MLIYGDQLSLPLFLSPFAFSVTFVQKECTDSRGKLLLCPEEE